MKKIYISYDNNEIWESGAAQYVIDNYQTYDTPCKSNGFWASVPKGFNVKTFKK